MTTMDNLAQLLAIYDNLLSAGIVKSQRDFALFLGASESTISKALKGDPKALTPRLLKRVELSAKQVLDTDKVSVEPSPEPAAVTHSEQDYLDIIKLQAGQLTKSQEQIDRLLTIIENISC